MRTNYLFLYCLAVATMTGQVLAQQANVPSYSPDQQKSIETVRKAPQNLAIKYMRDSEEYSTIVRQIYRVAGSAVAQKARSLPKGTWAVSIDIDETALDNSAYQLERAAYELEHDTDAFNAWALRREAGAVPGAVDFVNQVRKLGGKVAWISDRDASTSEATRQNLIANGLWSDDDRLCLRDIDGRSKSARRNDVVAGTGKCNWNANKLRLVAFIGDQMGDFPALNEKIPETCGDADFGRTCFLLPNPTYGRWTTRVTRTAE